MDGKKDSLAHIYVLLKFENGAKIMKNPVSSDCKRENPQKNHGH